jgi:hypothetical protein
MTYIHFVDSYQRLVLCTDHVKNKLNFLYTAVSAFQRVRNGWIALAKYDASPNFDS